MKRTTKLIALLLAVLLSFSGAVTAFASDDTQILPAPVDNAVDTSAFVKTVLENPKVKQANAEKLIAAVVAIANADEKIAQTLSQDVLTGQNVIAVIDSLINAISDKLESDPKFASAGSFIKLLLSNSVIESGLRVDEKFSGAADKLHQATEEGLLTVASVVEKEIEFTSADFGFTDGDAYGFVDALICSLLEIFSQLNVRTILGDFTDSVKDGSYVIGNYDLFVPLYELLELEPISSVEFTKRVVQAESATDVFGKARLRTAANLTLKPVADLLTRIEDKGTDAVIDLLPKLLYALDSGMVTELVRDLLRDKNLFYMFEFNDMLADLDLNTDLLWNVIDKKFITGTEDEPAGFDFDKDGEKETTLPLTKEQFDAIVKQLAYAADPAVKASVSSANKNRLALQTDDALVCAILCDAVVALLETEEGAAFAVKALAGLEQKIVRRIAEKFLSMFRSDFGRAVLRNIQSLLVSAVSFAAKIVSVVRSLRAGNARQITAA